MSQKKDSTVYLLLALFLGGIGIHQFYAGNSGKGWMYLLFFWTVIPAVLALFDAIGFKRNTRNANVAVARKVAYALKVPEDAILKLALI